MAYLSDIEIEEDEMTFVINTNNKLKTGFVNGLRRIMMSDIPIHCISTHKINFINNTCMFDNEYLKHRLGLVSIKNNTLKDLNDIVLSINKKNNTDEIISVYMGDFTVKQRDDDLKIENIIKFPKTLFTKLKPGQQIEIQTTLEEGIGRENSTIFTCINCILSF